MTCPNCGGAMIIAAENDKQLIYVCVECGHTYPIGKD